MKPPRWSAVSQSRFDWERDALEFARQHLPDHDPWRAWSNFEFIDDEGRVNEVDLLVLTPGGLVLVEIKSRPGTVRGDAVTWTWNTDGRLISVDNPLPLANRKAKRLASLLKRQQAVREARPTPWTWVEPLVFLSAVTETPRIDQGTAQRVVLRGKPGEFDDPGVIGALLETRHPRVGRGPAIDRAAAQVLVRALDQAGVRRAGAGRRLGDYELERLLTEDRGAQDFLGHHASTKVKRRIRIYPIARAATAADRERLFRAAAREFRILEGMDHPGIQGVKDYRESELGPALIFEFDETALRLDQYLAQHGERLTLPERLALVRQIAEAMAFAHGKRLFHRALAPQNVIVRDPETDAPRLQITNWRLASRGEASLGASLATAGTQHVEEYFSDPISLYAAPESDFELDEAAPLLDVFSLGAIAFHILAGRPPAESRAALTAGVRANNGLKLSSAINGVGEWLEELIAAATRPVVGDRMRDAKEFVEYVGEAEREARAPEEARATAIDPAQAAKGDTLDGDLTVIRRLGRGGSADALLVRRAEDEDDESFVLKVAIDEERSARVQAEAQILRSLRHPNIVRFQDEAVVAGRAAILMDLAGEFTLGQWIRGAEPLSLDLMRRFGDNLLSAVAYLEDQGIAHRDIKPDNIGVARAGAHGAYRLVLFDFSLSRAPLDNIKVGTPPYLDPFLADRNPQRWDLHAERYAAAVTLHEMLAGAPPIFGDGISDPLMLDAEATIAADRFDPTLRDSLRAFFERALRRDPTERFGDAEEMLRSWRLAFEQLDRSPRETDSLEVIARRLHGGSDMAEVGYGPEARDVLHRMGVQTVRQLLGVDRLKFRYLRGVGDKIRKEIRLRAKRLAELRPDLVPGGQTVDVPGRLSVDRLAGRLIPMRAADEETTDDLIVAQFLGLEVGDAPVWPDAGDVARRAEVSRGAVAEALDKARERWRKNYPELTDVRAELAGFLADLGGAASLDELADRLLALRGSAEEDAGERSRRAIAVIRAAAELEASVENACFRSWVETRPVLLAASPDHVEYARRLGRAADRLAGLDPLASVERVEGELGAVPVPDGVGVLPPGRRLRLAVAAAQRAALSSMMELYPRGMAAERALRLSLGALVGPQRLDEAALRARVDARFPAAEGLPARPALDAVLEAVGADRVWRDANGEASAGYYARAAFGSDSGTIGARRLATFGPPPEPSSEVLAARELEAKLSHAAETGAFLALLVEPRAAAEAKAEILRRYPRRVVSLEHLMLQAMRDEAQARRVDWRRALMADAAGPQGGEFRNLLRLVAQAAPRVRQAVLALDEPALLVCPGLLARYDQMQLLEDWAQASGASSGPPSLWLLSPQAVPGGPRIDGKVLPVVSGANWARLSDSWILNAHRAGQRAA